MHGSPKNYLHWLGYSFAPAIVCLVRGQVSLLVLLGLVLFLWLNRSSPLLAGAALWLCALKPQLFLPFGLVLVVWALATRNYRVLVGAGGAIALSAGLVTARDHAVWAHWAGMMRYQRLDRLTIPCLSNVLRRAISPDTMWLQYVPAALACIWALAYFWRHRGDWDWWKHGSPLLLVSLLTAPYTWLIDQTILIPVLLHGAYVSRSRNFVVVLALASAAIEVWPFLVRELTRSVWYAWTMPLWLVWYMLATRKPEAVLAATGAVAA